MICSNHKKCDYQYKVKDFLKAQSGVDVLGMTLPALIIEVHEESQYETTATSWRDK